ncbi:MAG: hypothetical protein HHJ12_16125 [Glaciimonas sp.]|nr:hypothetical protein [Glaciimonas sp.]
MKKSNQGLLAALSGVLLLTIAAAFRFTLERSMALHMLVQMPMLLGAGIACAFALSCVTRNAQNTPNRLQRGIAHLAGCRLWKIDEYGIVALTFFLLLSAYWMIPKALDDVLVSTTAETLKFAAFFIAGLALPAALARTNRVIQLFFLGNFAWMMAIVGILYQDTAVRLCNSYLLDDQVMAGRGLVVLSIAIPIIWFMHAARIGNKKSWGIF